MSALHDADRVLAHSLADEVYIRPDPDWYRPTWHDHARDVMEIVVGVVVLATLMLGIPFLLWLVAA